MKKTLWVLVLVGVVVAGCGPKKSLTLEERRQVVMDMEKETLERLYGMGRPSLDGSGED